MARRTTIFFDCAETLVETGWDMVRFTRKVARAVGLNLTDAALYRLGKMQQAAEPDFLRVNETRDAALGDAWWLDFTRRWLREIGEPPELAEAIVQESNRRLYGPDQTQFRLYDDVIPTLERLKADGFRMCIVSNWDYGLHRVVARLGLTTYFDHVFASLEEGVEKPDPELFQIALRRANVSASEVIHIGDRPVDDIEGAHAAGIAALLLDRSRTIDGSIDTLELLPQALSRAVPAPTL